jgi:hypothetical protein
MAVEEAVHHTLKSRVEAAEARLTAIEEKLKDKIEGKPPSGAASEPVSHPPADAA